MFFWLHHCTSVHNCMHTHFNNNNTKMNCCVEPPPPPPPQRLLERKRKRRTHLCFLLCREQSHRSMSLDFMMWFLAAVTLHGPKLKSCLLLLKPWDIIVDSEVNINYGKRKKDIGSLSTLMAASQHNSTGADSFWNSTR